ncbi:MAG: hypothetical protein GY941_00290 [Planctomycetes bacterium]|nr:hypothetical protein [Planctomycetota bacterium]
MGKITKLYLVFCAICLFLGSCKNIEHMFLENNTSETIFVKVFLLTEDGEQIMDTSIKPNANDGWSYEVDAIRKKEIDKKLKKLIIANDKGCKIELRRKEIIELVRKSGAWILVIDQSVMNCN